VNAEPHAVAPDKCVSRPGDQHEERLELRALVLFEDPRIQRFKFEPPNECAVRPDRQAVGEQELQIERVAG
jgi:hypothetical protein